MAPGDGSRALVAVVAWALLSGCAGVGSDGDAPPSRVTGTVAPDARPWERLLDEATGVRFEFPVTAEPVEDELVVAGQSLRTYTYSHVAGRTEVVLVLERVGFRLALDGPTVGRAATRTLRKAGDTDIRCSTPRGDDRRMRTTCRSVVTSGSERLTVAIAQSWRNVAATTIVAYTALPDESLHTYQVTGTLRKIVNSLRPGRAAI